MSSKLTDPEKGESVEEELKRFRLESNLPSIKTLVIVLSSVTLVACGVYPLVTKHFSLWNSGPISNAHRLIESDCKKCHSEPFKRVQDKECLTCHALSEHSKDLASFVEKHTDLNVRCSTCHMEHNGDRGLLLKDADFCVNCHGDMKGLKGDSELLSVSHFNSHPQFRIKVAGEPGKTERVSLDDQTRVKDNTKIKLNHSVHLKAGLRGKNGPVDLTCRSCHQIDGDFKKIKPISFDSHCRDCHSLGFDERLPDAQVPHGDSEAVYPALFTEYSKLMLGGEVIRDTSNLERQFPSSDHGVSIEALKPKDLAAVEDSARDAEKLLFTKTGCYLCHSYKEKDPNECTKTGSRYLIDKPEIPEVWLPAARFSHGAHEEFSCESCHKNVANSTETTDVLIPGIALCRDCHQQDAKPGYVESGCGECHSYHAALGFPNEKKQSISDYLRSLTR